MFPQTMYDDAEVSADANADDDADVDADVDADPHGSWNQRFHCIAMKIIMLMFNADVDVDATIVVMLMLMLLCGVIQWVGASMVILHSVDLRAAASPPFEIIWPSEKPSDHLAFCVPTQWLSAKQFILFVEQNFKKIPIIADDNSMKLKGARKCAAASFEEIRPRGGLICPDKIFTPRVQALLREGRPKYLKMVIIKLRAKIIVTQVWFDMISPTPV